MTEQLLREAQNSRPDRRPVRVVVTPETCAVHFLKSRVWFLYGIQLRVGTTTRTYNNAFFQPVGGARFGIWNYPIIDEISCLKRSRINVLNS